MAKLLSISRNLLAIGVCFAFAQRVVFGAEMLFHPGFTDRSHIIIAGEIVAGDSSKFQSMMSSAKPLTTVAIYSPGGDLVEAKNIGRQIRDWFLPTVTADDGSCIGVQQHKENYNWWPETVERVTACQCYSACFIIWSAGITRSGGDNLLADSYGMGMPGLTKFARSEPTFLGIHRPRFEQRYFAELNAREAEALYDSMMSELQQYLIGMDVPDAIAQRVSLVASDDLHYLSKEDHEALTSSFIPPVDEWLNSRCGHHFSRQEQRDYQELIHKNSDALERQVTLSDLEQNYMSALLEKGIRRGKCQRDALEEEQLSRIERKSSE